MCYCCLPRMDEISMKKPMYIALDTETGGLGSSVSLLSVYFVILDEDFNLIDELDLLTKPDDGIFHVEGQALGINKIDLAKHHLEAITYKQAATKIYNLLAANKGDQHLIPIGHNVTFDIQKVCNNTLNKKSWDCFVGYRKLDTGDMAIDRIITGHLPKDLNAGLGSLAKHFNIEFEAHTAKGDTWATVKVCKAMLDLTKK